MRKTLASKRKKDVSSTFPKHSEDDSEESPEETEDDEELQSKLPAAPTTRKSCSWTEVVERIKKMLPQEACKAASTSSSYECNKNH